MRSTQRRLEGWAWVLILAAGAFSGCTVSDGDTSKSEAPVNDSGVKAKHADPVQPSIDSVPKPEEKPQAVDVGPVFEPLVELPKPVPSMPVPKVKVRDLGLQPSPVPGIILDAFTDANGRPKYFVTEREIFFMKPDGRIMKKMSRKSDPRKNREAAGVGFSDDGQWVWQVYVPAEHAGDRLYYEAAATEVYDDKGKPWWTVAGSMESISPSGKRAVVALPESAGLVLHERESKTEKMVADKGTAMSWACAFDDGYLYVSSGDRGSEISVYDANLEKKVVSRFKALCTLDSCLPSSERVFVDCSAPWDGVTMLLLLDSAGREIARTWFPTVGNRYLDVDCLHGRALIGVDTGEALILEIMDGKTIALTRRIDGLSEMVTQNRFEGSKEEYRKYLAKHGRETEGKYLVERVELLEGSIARVMKKHYIPGDVPGEDPERIFELVDFSGTVLFTRRFLSQDPASEFRFNLRPAIWREHKTARVAIAGKVQAVEVTPEVEP